MSALRRWAHAPQGCAPPPAPHVAAAPPAAQAEQ
eukprot:gene1803-6212_t